jgi:hypothetical protein
MESKQPKKEYATPKLTSYGTVEDLTSVGIIGSSDSIIFPGSSF